MKKCWIWLLVPAFAFCACGPASDAAKGENDMPVTDVSFQKGYINVRDFGAAGDGTADDTESLNKAVGAGRERGAFTLWFSKGTYRIAGQVEFPRSAELVFEDGAALSLDAGSNMILNAAVTAGPHPVFVGEGDFDGLLDNAYVLPDWFGAEADGKTDDSEAVRKALNHGNEIVFWPHEKGYGLTRVPVESGKRVRGWSEKRPGKIVGLPECKDLFVLPGGVKNVAFSDLDFDMSATGASTCFFFDTASGPSFGADHVDIRNIRTEGAYHVVRDGNGDPAKVYNNNIVLDGFECRNSRESVILTGNFWGFIFFRNMVLDNSGLEKTNTSDGNYAAVEFANNAGAILQNIRIVGTGNSKNDKEHGFFYKNNVATWMKDCRVENVGGNGVEIRSGSHLYFNDVEISKTSGHGFRAGGAVFVQCAGLQIAGTSGRETHGLLLEEVRHAMMTDVSVSGASANGVMLRSGGFNTFTRLVASRNAGYGYFDAGTSNVLAEGKLEKNGKQLRVGENGRAVDTEAAGKALGERTGVFEQ